MEQISLFVMMWEDAENVKWTTSTSKRKRKKKMKPSNLAIELLKSGDINGVRNVAKANKIILNLHEMIELLGE